MTCRASAEQTDRPQFFFSFFARLDRSSLHVGHRELIELNGVIAFKELARRTRHVAVSEPPILIHESSNLSIFENVHNSLKLYDETLAKEFAFDINHALVQFHAEMIVV